MGDLTPTFDGRDFDQFFLTSMHVLKGLHMGAFDSLGDDLLQAVVVFHIALGQFLVSRGVQDPDHVIGTDPSFAILALGNGDEVFRTDQNQHGDVARELAHIDLVGHMKTVRTRVVPARINLFDIHEDPRADTLFDRSAGVVEVDPSFGGFLHPLVANDPAVVGQRHLGMSDEAHQVFGRVATGFQNRCHPFQEVLHGLRVVLVCTFGMTDQVVDPRDSDVFPSDLDLGFHLFRIEDPLDLLAVDHLGDFDPAIGEDLVDLGGFLGQIPRDVQIDSVHAGDLALQVGHDSPGVVVLVVRNIDHFSGCREQSDLLLASQHRDNLIGGLAQLGHFV